MVHDSEVVPQQAAFGANQWLIDEMRDEWRDDVGSVTPQWRAFFEAEAARGNGAATTAPASVAPEATAPASAPAPTPSAPEAAPPAPVRTPAPPSEAPPAAKAVAPAAPPAPAAPRAQRTVPASPHLDQRGELAPQDNIRADLPPAVPQPPTAVYVGEVATKSGTRLGEAGTSKLRGPAARVVANMETSLGVPTATSVRAIPAKLLWDNRIVVNNHLARTRGGKVSFTHLIGYAVVEALTEMPEMNARYTEVEGKPAVDHPEHVGFGLAIDLA